MNKHTHRIAIGICIATAVYDVVIAIIGYLGPIECVTQVALNLTVAHLLHRNRALTLALEEIETEIEAQSGPFVYFNINDYVQVQLNKYGRECLQKNCDELNETTRGRVTFKTLCPIEDEEGWSRWRAWSLIAELGKHMSLGLNPPFEMAIRLEVETSNTQPEQS